MGEEFPHLEENDFRFGARGLCVFFCGGSEYGPEPRVVVDDFEEAVVVGACGVGRIFFVGVLDEALA